MIRHFGFAQCMQLEDQVGHAYVDQLGQEVQTGPNMCWLLTNDHSRSRLNYAQQTPIN